MLPQWSRYFLSSCILKSPRIPNTQKQCFSTNSSILDLCTNSQHLLQIHARFILHGFSQNPTLSSKLVDCYANFGNLFLAHQVFESITKPTSTLYKTFLRNLYKFGEYKQTLLVYQEVVEKSLYPDEDAYPFVLKSCSWLSEVETGKMIHGHVVKLGFDAFELVGNSLVEMYSSWDNFEKEGDVSEGMHFNGSFCWNSLISEASQNGNAEESFRIFKKMRMERCKYDSVTVINLLRSSVDLKSLSAGKSVHCLGVVSNLCEDMSVSTALLSMYSKLGSLKNAKLLFKRIPQKDNVVWNVMISAYSRHGCQEKSLKLLRCMGRSGVRADLFTALAALSSISEFKSIEWGKQMHAHVMRNGSDYHASVHNSLIDMYCKCDHVPSARRIFDSVTNKNIVSWSSMIKGYVNHNQCHEALSLFTKMKLDGIGVDSVTLINILPAFVDIGALEQVKYLHGISIKYGLNSVTSFNTTLLVSYAKCGCIEMARKLFDEEKIDSKDLIMWNSMISAYSKHGECFQCFELYNQMKQSKLKPDGVTFLALLTACVNSGFVDKGWRCFKEMSEIYGCKPSQEHYACMVDLLGRVGRISEAKELINSMPFEPDARIWGPLLSACKIHSETGLAEHAAEKLITLEPKNAGNYILLSNIYAAAGKWDGVAKMRSFLRDRGLKKTLGCSWLEINGKVHEFCVADRYHPKSYDIYTILGSLEFEINEIRERLKSSQNQLSF